MARRRGNGEGSILQRSDGRWQASIVLDGKRQYYYGNTRKEAQQKLERAKQQSANGLGVANDQVTIGKFLGFWINEVIAPNVRPTTLRTYTTRINKYLIPYFDKVKIQRLTPQQVVVFQNTLIRRGVTPSTVRDCKSLLSMALKQAMIWGIVARNVASVVTAPSVPKRDVPVPNASDIRAMLSAAETTMEELMVALGALLGMRNAEVRGLRWRDVDLQQKTIEVRMQISASTHGVPAFVPLKTRASRRTLPIPDPLVALIRRHHAEQLRARMAVASIWHDYDLVICGPEGMCYSNGSLLIRFQSLCARAGLPAFRFHSLRHACASMLADAGVPIKTAMDILGHTDPSMTQQIYTHSYPEAKQRAVDALGGLLEATG